LILVRNYGGVRLYVPVNMTPDHILSGLICFELAIELAVEFGGMDHFDIPRATGAIRVVRNRQIANKFITGNSLRQLSREFAMTEHGIVKVLSSMGTSMEDRQSRLF
jgi:Mor family transcriptional regulator